MSQPPGEQGDDDQGASAENVPAAAPAPTPIRASDAEREQVAEVVRQAVSDGRLTIVEGDERLREVYAARFRRDLAPITADLGPTETSLPPSTGSAPVRRPLGRIERPSTSWSVAVLSGAQKRGEWTPGRTHSVVAFWGGAELSFRDARIDDAGLTIAAVAIMAGIQIDLRGIPAGVEVTVQAVAIMAGIEVLVDQDTRVEDGGFGFLGAFEDGSGAPRSASGPRVRVRGLALMGGVSVSRKPLAVEGGDDGDRPAIEG
ncbi:DUF1707 SHOCT-like domain-containing protein [Actinomycetospora cinnamomea]|uniref:Uncharacterized protein DUF1707 n=1 Tax=Actinomycetospora cinnamomea TaxID=663609 RepID=A0A2U1FL94_9PSEU|nr:DUF1707 domain-containing protein [Actinomycetospora cinnamomea]PVZ12954.1 uncharacterized protein DUF1707 [Actinomycetospora cinnamomea]